VEPRLSSDDEVVCLLAALRRCVWKVVVPFVVTLYDYGDVLSIAENVPPLLLCRTYRGGIIFFADAFII
jgi:hypothetical protein